MTLPRLLGVIAMLVVMALVTTFTTAPILDIIKKREWKRELA